MREMTLNQREFHEKLETFEQVFAERYVPMVRLAIALVDRRSQAEEIVQESYRQLWERFDSVETPSAYLRRSVVNGCRQELRRRLVRRRLDPMLRVRHPSPEQHFLLDALDGLSERKKTALVLRYYADLSIREIAETMSVKEGTAKSLISRGIDDLRKVIR